MEEITIGTIPGVPEHPSLALVDSAGILPGDRTYDELATPESTGSWLRAHDLVAEDAVLYEHCRDRLTGLRVATRELMMARIEGALPSGASVQALNSALTSAPGVLRLRVDAESGFVRTAEHPATQVVEHAMALIAEDAASLLVGEEAPMLALCEADSCDRIFLRTHARRQWCSTRCGDRMRAARAYARKRAALSS
jgi:predicted RNA-binding Zn ribbon-like protein